MSNTKKIVIGVIIAILVMLFGLTAIVVFVAETANNTIDEVETEIKNEEIKLENDVSKLEIENLHQEGDKLVGMITNTLNYNISYLEIDFKFYDKDGVTIYDDMTNKTNFSMGEKWRFELYLMEENFDSYDYEIEMSVY